MMTQTHAATVAAIRPSIAAVLALAREVVAYERAQAERHFENYRMDYVCDCDDCTGRAKYPAHWSAIARRILNNA